MGREIFISSNELIKLINERAIRLVEEASSKWLLNDSDAYMHNVIIGQLHAFKLMTNDINDLVSDMENKTEEF